MTTILIPRRSFGLALGLLGAGAIGAWAWPAAASASAPASAASVTASLRQGVLTVTGTAGPDIITVRLKAGDPNTLEVDVGADGTADFSFLRSTVTAITVSAGDGDDIVTVSHVNGLFSDTIPTTFNGEGGADTLIGDVGAERLNGGAGADVIDGNIGADIVDGGGGADVFQWDPGDGSDTIVGGPGNDRLTFNGSNIGEVIDVSNVAGHVQLTRNVAAIVMDLDEIEGLTVNTLAGADTVTVHDLTGTDLTQASIDVSGSGGADDGVVDSVEVPAGVTFSSDGPIGVASGVGARVSVVNAGGGDSFHVIGATADDSVTIAGTSAVDTINATSDGPDAVFQGGTGNVLVRLTAVERVTVNLGGGDDHFTGVGNLAPLTTITVNGDGGADTLLGGNGADTLNGGAGADVIDGNIGADIVDGGGGADVFQWDPGDGSDTIVGGPGNDRLTFNGSNIGEVIDVSNVAGHVQLTRNVAAIVMDLDEIEGLTVNTLAGADTVTVHDLTGTDLTQASIDVSGSGGADDGVVDSVEVPAGVTFSSDGPIGVASGVGARVSVVNAGGGDSFHVIGATADDSVTIAGTSAVDTINATSDGPDAVFQGGTGNVLVRLTAVDRVTVNLGGGDDHFTGVGNLAPLTTITVNGDGGADTLLGGNGADTLNGGAGADVIDGNIGADIVDGGGGADVFQWDPGDGSDTIVGGPGNDRLTFNGSNIGEVIDVSNVAGHVQLTRNVAAIVMDLDEIEGLTVNTLAGADTVTVHDLTGTDLTQASIDLGALGVADGVPDTVIVNGTDGDDHVAVTDDGADVVVAGLSTSVRVSHADAASDQLLVNGLLGNDTITATPGAGSLVILSLVP